MSMTLRLGEVTLHRIVEIETGASAALEMFPGLTPERLAASRLWLQPAALDADDNLILCFQSFVVRTPDHVVLVDSCLGNGKESLEYPLFHKRTSDAWMRGLTSHGLRVDDIDVVVSTHLHVDHIGWNTSLVGGRWVPTFPNARYLFAQIELDHWIARQERTPEPSITESVVPVINAGRSRAVDADHEIDAYVRLVPTPGHTIGHCSVAIGRRGTDAVITGDMIHSPLQARYPELTTGIDHDPAQAIATRTGFLRTYCDTDTIVCFSHFPSPSWGRVKRWEDGFRSEPVI